MAKEKRQQEGERSLPSQTVKPQCPEDTGARSTAIVNSAWYFGRREPPYCGDAKWEGSVLNVSEPKLSSLAY